MKVLDLNHVALQVQDLAATCAFYGDLLGLEQKARPDFDFEGAWFKLGPERELHIIAGRTGEPLSHSRGNHLALEVESSKETAEYLVSKGVEFIGPSDRPDGAKQLFVVDPDGYYVELTQLR